MRNHIERQVGNILEQAQQVFTRDDGNVQVGIGLPQRPHCQDTQRNISNGGKSNDQQLVHLTKIQKNYDTLCRARRTGCNSTRKTTPAKASTASVFKANDPARPR